jgi:hypothetical protein
MLLEIIATLSAGLFAGAAIYIDLASSRPETGLTLPQP